MRNLRPSHVITLDGRDGGSELDVVLGWWADMRRGWVQDLIFFIIAYAVATMVTLIYQPHMVNHIRHRPFLFLIVLADMLIIAN